MKWASAAVAVRDFFFEAVEEQQSADPPQDPNASVSRAAGDGGISAQVEWKQRVVHAAAVAWKFTCDAVGAARGAFARWRVRAAERRRLRQEDAAAAAARAGEACPTAAPCPDVGIADPVVLEDLDAAIDAIEFEMSVAEPELTACVEAIARWIGPLAASEAHHDAGAGGLLRHCVAALRKAAPRIREAPQAMRLAPDEGAFHGDAIRMGLCVGVLTHDLGKIFDQRVSVGAAVWDPMAEPLTEFSRRIEGALRVTWRSGRGDADDPMYHARLWAPAMGRVIEPRTWTFMRPIGGWVLRGAAGGRPAQTATEGELSFAKLFGDVVVAADHAAVADAEEDDVEAAAVSAAGSSVQPSKAPYHRQAQCPPAAASPTVAVAAATLKPAAPRSPRATKSATAEAPATEAPVEFLLQLPKFRGILPIDDFVAAAEKHGLNELESPLIVGGFWFGVDVESPFYVDMIEPYLPGIVAADMIARCDLPHDESGTSSDPHEGCKEMAHFATQVILTPDPSGPRCVREMIFIHQRALSAPIPQEIGSFPGRVAFSDHGPRLHDLLKCVSGDGRDVLAELIDSVRTDLLRRDRDWFVISGAEDASGRRIGLSYDTAVEVLLGSRQQQLDEEDRRKIRRGLWDRLFRDRVHVLPRTRRVAHTVRGPNGRKEDVVVLTAAVSEDLLRSVGC